MTGASRNLVNLFAVVLLLSTFSTPGYTDTALHNEEANLYVSNDFAFWLLQSDYIDMWMNKEVTSWVLHMENGEVDET